jgi:hypothetical protein
VPQTFNDLLADMRGFIPFAICFAIFAQVWWLHHNFFRRYGLDDGITATLNFVLLFVMLFYTYPLKFLFSGMFSEITGRALVRGVDNKAVKWIEGSQGPTLMIIYGLGYATVYLVFTMLYWNALRQRHSLELNRFEVFDTYSSIMESGVMFGVGVLCAVLAAVLPVRVAGMAGLSFFMIPVGMTVLGMTRGKARRQLEARTKHHAGD